MSIDRIWAGWRSTYIESVTDDEGLQLESDAKGRSLFERIYESGESDEATHIVWHGRLCFAILNAYPYGSGHLMLLPKRKVAMLEDLTDEEYTELWGGVRAAVVAIKTAYHPDGVNVGANLGRGAGAGVPDHLHVHVLPRWVADSNFMTAVAETRVLPEPLDVTWEKLRRSWPEPSTA
jgi:ATP adenylyltransferase